MINFALVGCGRISKRHAELLGKNMINGAKLISVCDIHLPKALSVANLYNVKAYDNMDIMMQNENVDIVVVLTPSGLHSEHVINLSKYKKNIIVEKPMALNNEDANLMIDACNKNECKLFVILQNRFNIPVIKLREAIEKGRFGKIILGTVRVRWARSQEYYDQDSWRGSKSMDGGVISNQAIHHIDLLEWMIGDVESVFAKTSTSLLNIEAEDTAVVTIKFKNGALGIIEATVATRPKDLEGSISILGEKGSVVIGGFAVNKLQSWNFLETEKEDKDVKEKYSNNPPDIYGFGHKTYYENVIKNILDNDSNIISGLEGKKSIKLIEAIYKSAKLRKEIFLK